jgi:putative ABC transport system substrate-binding protein
VTFAKTFGWAAQVLGMKLLLPEIREPSDFEGTFDALAREQAGALFVFGDSMMSVHRVRLAELALRHRLPAVYTNRPHVEVGGLMSYGPSFTDLWRRAATYVDKVLKGAKPADLPVEQPTKFELVVNARTAKALGIALPPALLVRADEVIE